MDRDRITLALVVGLAVVGAALAGATFGSADFSGSDADDDAGGAATSAELTSLVFLSLFVVLALAIAGGVGLAVRRGHVTPGQLALWLVAALVLLLVAVAIVGAGGGEDFEVPELPGSGSGTGAGAGAQDQPGGNGDGSTAIDPVGVLAVLGGVVLLGVLAVVLFARGGATHEEPSDPGDEPARAAVGRAAGTAADRIGSADLSNAVYSAWTEMVDALDVAHPAATTPAEFADAAIDAGVDEADARRLTELFREVRYGDAAVTDDRAARARETLRRIEATYADEPEPEADGDRGDPASGPGSTGDGDGGALQ